MKEILGIMPVSIGGRLTTSSLLDGFRQSGYNVTIYDELFNKFQIKNRYDLIVGYDFSPLKIKHDYNLTMKAVCYFSDVIRNKTSGEFWQELLPILNEPDNYIFYWDRELIKTENIQNIFYLPHFVNTAIYKNKDLKSDCDVMFAGRLDTDYRLNMVTDIAKEFSLKWYAIDRHYQDALNRADDKSLIEKIYSGFIDNENDMANAINKTRIVINMNSQGISSLNYRTMQTIACGKLLISDNRAELDLFDNKIPVYTNITDLKKLIQEYLSDINKYNETVKYCTDICRNKYNSVEGVKYILSKIQ